MRAVRTDDLIAVLGAQAQPTPPNAAVRRLCLASLIGGLVAFGLLLVGLGVRPDIAAASATAPFWVKWVFTLSLTAAGVVVVRRLGQPDGRVGWTGLMLATPFAIVAMMALGELMLTPAPLREGLVFGHTAPRCAISIVLLSAPVFVACVWAFRRLAPTRLRMAGSAAGVLSGAVGAAIYAFSCPETSAAFMITWYTTGILVAGGLGALLGRPLLKW
jgi:hypothetical protein